MDQHAHLQSLLEHYQPPSDEEKRYKFEMLKLLELSPSCFSRGHYQPGHFTASAFVLSPDDRQLLLILHAKLGLWLQPGGHIEPDDANLLAAARREVNEEVGMQQIELAREGLFDIDVHHIPSSTREPSHQHFDVRFLFRAIDTTVVAGSDARDARWVPLDEVVHHHSDASVMRAVRRLHD